MSRRPHPLDTVVTEEDNALGEDDDDDDEREVDDDDDDDDENEEPDEEEKTGAQEDEWLMSCRSSSARSIATLLSCLHSPSSSSSSTSQFFPPRFSSNGNKVAPDNDNGGGGTIGIGITSKSSKTQLVTVFCHAHCLTFHVHSGSKQFQASVDIPAAWFDEYHVAEPAAAAAVGVQDEAQSQPMGGGEVGALNFLGIFLGGCILMHPPEYCLIAQTNKRL